MHERARTVHGRASRDAPIAIAPAGHAATHSPQPVQAAAFSLGRAGAPIIGTKRMARSGHTSPQDWQMIPDLAKQPSSNSASGRPLSPPRNARRERPMALMSA